MASKRIGRPPHQPDKEQRLAVRILASCGYPHKSIAAYIGITDETLRTHYRSELDYGSMRTIHDVARNMYVIAATGKGSAAVNAGKYWLGCRAGWKEASSVEMVGKDGGPLQIMISKDDAAL
jgi:hypothetical protein